MASGAVSVGRNAMPFFAISANVAPRRHSRVRSYRRPLERRGEWLHRPSHARRPDDRESCAASYGRPQFCFQKMSVELRPWACSIIAVELDPVGAVGSPDCARRARSPRRRLLLPRPAAGSNRADNLCRGTVRVRGHDGARGDEQAWARDSPSFYGAFQSHIGVACAFGSQIAQGRETRMQRRSACLQPRAACDRPRLSLRIWSSHAFRL